jgi:hypothetical protein
VVEASAKNEWDFDLGVKPTDTERHGGNCVVRAGGANGAHAAPSLRDERAGAPQAFQVADRFNLMQNCAGAPSGTLDHQR